MGASGIKIVSLEEYLARPEYERCEYVSGDVVELHLGSRQHSKAQVQCGRRLAEYLDGKPIGAAYSELHCRMKVGEEVRFRLPDVCVVIGEFSERYLDRAPDLCVEIRSPEDLMADLIGKFQEYFANGCKLGWILLPEEKTVLVLSVGAVPRAARVGEFLDGGEVLPGLSIAVVDLFA